MKASSACRSMRTERPIRITGSRWSAVEVLKCGPTIAAEAGDVRSIFTYRSSSMKVISPGPASPTGRAAVRGPIPVRLAVRCPQCGSLDTREIARFGSTSCKALYECRACLEPFDHFKAH